MRQGLLPAQQFGVELGEFLYPVIKVVEGGGGGTGGVLAGGRLEQKLVHLSRRQALRQIIKGAVFLSASAGAVGFAAGVETLNDGGTDEVGRQPQLAEEPLPALPKPPTEKEPLGSSPNTRGSSDECFALRIAFS